MNELKTIIPLGILLAILIATYVAIGGLRTQNATDVRVEPAAQEARATDVVMAGPALFEPTGAQDKMYVGDEDGKRTELILDAESICAGGSGALPCIAMSSLYSSVFKDKTIVVEGNWQGDAILVKKLRVLMPGESQMPQQPGSIYIPWQQAVGLIKTCQVEMITQSHALDVYLKLKGGREVVAVEPTIDAVFTVYGESQAACGSIPVATE